MTSPASTSCSRLSITRSTCPRASRSAARSATSSVPVRVVPTASAIAEATSAGSAIADRSTNPAGVPAARTFSAAASARRVLPIPPLPVSVTSRASPESSDSTSESSPCPAHQGCCRRRQPQRRPTIARGAASDGSCCRMAALQLPRLLGGLEPEPVEQLGAPCPQPLQRLHLASGAVERECILPLQRVPVGVPGNLRLQFGQELVVATGGEIGLQPQLERDQPLLGEVAGLGSDRFAGEVGERVVLPQVESRSQVGSAAGWSPRRAHGGRGPAGARIGRGRARRPRRSAGTPAPRSRCGRYRAPGAGHGRRPAGRSPPMPEAPLPTPHPPARPVRPPAPAAAAEPPAARAA